MCLCRNPLQSYQYHVSKSAKPESAKPESVNHRPSVDFHQSSDVVDDIGVLDAHGLLLLSFRDGRHVWLRCNRHDRVFVVL